MRDGMDRIIDLQARIDAEKGWPRPLNLPALLATSPSPPAMIIDDWLPAGYATLLAGHGGAGKSNIALHLAACIATGRRWWGLHCAMRKVLYLSCEDRANVLHWRLSHIARLEEIAPDDLGGLHIVDLVGRDSILYRRDPHIGATVTAAFAELERLMSETGSEVLIVDGASDTYGASENDRSEVKAFVNHLVRLVGLNGAVIILAHVNKATAAGGSSEGYSGSTQWHNAVRARWYLHPEIERTDEGTERTGNLILALQKSNHGRDDQAITFRWDDSCHMFVAEAAPKRINREDRDDRELIGIEAAIREVIERGDYVPAAMQGPRTALHVLAATDALPPSLKDGSRASKRRFARHLETLRRNRIVRECSIRRANRHVVAALTLARLGD